jgi:hypothetical protein
MRKILSAIFIALAGLALTIVPLATRAQTPPPSLQFQSLAITPFLIETDLEPSQTTTHYITLANTGDKNLSIAVSINDFIPVEKTGQPRFLDASESGDPRFSVSSWIKITKQPLFTIPPYSDTTLEFTVTAPINAEPGTHYGGILFTYNPNATAVPGGSEVTEKVGTIVLAKLGQSEDKGAITEFFEESAPTDPLQANFSLTFHNFGNAHTRPKGEIFITNIFGQPVTEGYVNPDANIVLPDSERIFASQAQKRLGIGRYTATAVIYYGSPKLEARTEITFWVWPWKRVLIVAGLLILFGLISFFGLKRYDRWIIKRAKL